MGDIHLQPTGTTSFIVIEPEYSSTFTKNLQREDLRGREGQLFTYIEAGTFKRFELPWSFVNSSDRSRVNGWWEAGTDLELIIDSTFPSSLYDVRIVESEEPFDSFIRPYFNVLFEGELVLETT
jgi:hypothetical protein